MVIDNPYVDNVGFELINTLRKLFCGLAARVIRATGPDDACWFEYSLYESNEFPSGVSVLYSPFRSKERDAAYNTQRRFYLFRGFFEYFCFKQLFSLLFQLLQVQVSQL